MIYFKRAEFWHRTGCHAPGRRPGSRPGQHLDQNVLACYAPVAPASILGLSGGLFSARRSRFPNRVSNCCMKAGQRPAPLFGALLHGPEQIADLPVPVVESPGAVRIGHPERGHLVEYLAPNSVFNSLPRQRSCPLLGPDDRFVTIDCLGA